MKTSNLELYRKYRPRKLSGVVGQPSAVKMLRTMIKRDKVPHAILFVGPSGCGKTTLARILRVPLGCGRADFTEVNSADYRGIDMVREIRQQVNLAPIAGDSKVFLIDECQKLTSDGQSAMLKMLEDTPDHAYFFLCTTDPHKLLPTIRTRCTEVKVSLLGSEDISELVRSVARSENIPVYDEVVDSIVDKAEGSARKALVLLNQVMGLEDQEDMLKALSKSDTRAQAIQLARLLIQPRPSWTEVVKILNRLDEDPESIRRMMLGYAASVLKGNGKLAPRALLLLDVFGGNFYDSGEAGLVAACYAVATGK